MSITAKILITLSLLIGTGSNTVLSDVKPQQDKAVIKPKIQFVQPIVKTKANGQIVNVNTDLNVREKSNIDSKVIFKLKNGMTIKIKSKEGDWYKIEREKQIGYVSKDYIQEYDTKAPNPIYVKPKPMPKPKPVEKETSDSQDTNTNVDYSVSAELTAYDNSQESSGNWGSLTAMGTHTREGVVAAPKEIPLGTKLYIPSLKWYNGTGIFSVEDRGGAVKVKPNGNYVIDVWFKDGTNLDKFGRQFTKIYILKK